MANITKTATTITIDGVTFSNDYIEFRQHYWSGIYHDEHGNVPTSKCFVHVWQKCKDLDDFMDKLSTLWHDYVVYHPNNTGKTPITVGNASRCWKTQKWNNPGGLRLPRSSASSRASTYRRKGVKLKSYPRPDTSWKGWESLNNLAQESL